MKLSKSIVRSLSGIIFLSVLNVVPANAAVTILEHSSSIRSNGDVSSPTRSESWSVQERNATNLNSFLSSVNETRISGQNSSTGNASIDSKANTLTLTGSGSAQSIVTYVHDSLNNSFFSRPSASARSEFEVTFELDIATAFQLMGDLSYVGERFDGGVTASLRNGGNFSSSTTFNLSLGNSSPQGNFDQSINFSGLLDPGTYVFSLYANTRVDLFSNSSSTTESFAEYDVSLKFGTAESIENWSSEHSSAVPVPAAAWLFASALIGMQSVRRR